MPRDIPVGNGQLLVTYDQHYQVRDLYFPHVGLENHVGGNACHFGVYGSVPQTHESREDRRKHRLYWTRDGWQIDLKYLPQTLATDVRLQHRTLQVDLRCHDVVDFHRPLLVRRIEVTNACDQARALHLFHHNNFAMYNTRVGDTAYFDPQLRSIIHYRQNRYLMATWHAAGETRIDEFATGTAGFGGAEGTFRDAEDGKLGGNTIAQGAVDSTMMIRMDMGPRQTQVAYLLLGAGHSYADLVELHKFLHRESPQIVIDRTNAYWREWLGALRVRIPGREQGGPPPAVVDLFRRSLLVVRSQIDNSGAIIAANDTDIMQFSRDTYSYLWPRDGALVASALDMAGFPNVTRQFYTLCERIMDPRGFFLHKYNPDGSPASSWHPWASMGRPQLPIQEDETALVVWALWRHYVLYRQIEFVRPLWAHMIVPAADFMVKFRDPDTHLPLPSYDLWEERWGVHAFTVATVYGGLEAARQFAECFGDTKRAAEYELAAAQVRAAFEKHFWSEEHQRFLRRIVPLDHERTSSLMATILAGQTPRNDYPQPIEEMAPAAGARPGDHARAAKHEFELDTTIDSAMYAIFAFGLLPVSDERVEKTMQAIASRLWVKTPVGGLARYENDSYHRVSHDTKAVPGNPWFICTLWLAQWKIAKARDPRELAEAMPILEWVASHALPSGVLAEQVHPHTNAPMSVSPLTWSHATVVTVLVEYLRKLESMRLCSECGQPVDTPVPYPLKHEHALAV